MYQCLSLGVELVGRGILNYPLGLESVFSIQIQRLLHKISLAI